MPMELVTIGKKPTERAGITGTFNYAMRKAREQGWSKMIIMGENPDGSVGKTICTRMTFNTSIAMLTKAQHVMLRDSCDGN